MPGTVPLRRLKAGGRRAIVKKTVRNDFRVFGGCRGNLQGIARLVVGMDVDEVIARLDGIRCGSKATSCPDQLAQALKAMKAEA